MASKKNTLRLDLEDRYDNGYAVIHATGDQHAGTHWAVAQVVVRMNDDEEDTPGLVKFAHELVNRYNQHEEMLSIVEEFTSVMQERYDLPDTASSQENIARVAGKARKLINEIEGGAA